MHHKKKKWLLLLPVFVVPLLLVCFWIFRSGSAEGQHNITQKRTGINTELPDAKLKNGPENKMAFYDWFTADSSKTKERAKHDRLMVDDTASAVNKAYSQLDALERAMQLQPVVPARSAWHHQPLSMQTRRIAAQVDEVVAPDPEIQQLDSLLDKIIRVQHPEQAAQPARHSTTPNFLQLKPRSASPVFDDEDGFVDIVNRDTIPSSPVVNALIDQRQSIVPGSMVTLRTVAETTIGDVVLPKGHLLSGVSSMSGERIHIHVASVLSGTQFIAVSLDVVDLDGITGIYVPHSLTGDVIKQSGMRTLGSGIGGLGAQVGAQLATAGIDAGKQLLTKRSRQRAVHLPAGYRVLLINQSK